MSSDLNKIFEGEEYNIENSSTFLYIAVDDLFFGLFKESIYDTMKSRV